MNAKTIFSYLLHPKSTVDFVKSMKENKYKTEYTLTFEQDPDGRWYIVCPEYPGPRANLEMVAGADELLSVISKESGDNPVTIKVSKEGHPKSSVVVLERKEVGYGATYEVTWDYTNESGKVPEVWLCPVTLFVLGEYPKYIYIDY